MGTSATNGDLSQQKVFIDFALKDSNSNETPQVRIGAEVGENADANAVSLEGSGAFVVYTNDADTDAGDAGSSLQERMRVDYAGNMIVTGNVTAYGSVSDIRLKENVEVIPDALEKVKKLDGVTFNYKKDGSRSTGLIAQQLQEVLEEAVYETADPKSKEAYLAIHYGNVVGLLVEAMKEQSAQIESLNKRIKELENGDH